MTLYICKACGANWGHVYLLSCPMCGGDFLTEEELNDSPKQKVKTNEP